MRLHTVQRKLVRKFFQFLHSLFYMFVFGHRVPFAGKLEKIINSWERLVRKGDIPVSRDAWESQYSDGQWAYMKQLGELGRYSIIVGYIAFFKVGPAVLDVGCGEGILFERYKMYGYSKYVGIEISEVALAKLAQKQDEKTIFIRANVETYTLAELFDVIIFNETLYYLYDPLVVIEAYSHILKKNGILIVSTYTLSKRAMSILRKIKTKYFLLDESKTTHEFSSWICSVFVPGAKET